MDKTLSSALSALHKTVLKPVGFSKHGGTFSRVHPGHMELFNIQSSQWNGPWGRCFYVNCGAVFKDFVRQYPRPSLTAIQWGCRIRFLAPGAPEKWEYSDETMDSVRQDLGQYILIASQELSGNLGKYKEQYLDIQSKLAARRLGNNA